jgi:hypothetical protein
MNTETIITGNDDISIDLATEFGPRVVGLTPTGATNLFADLGDLAIDLPDHRRFTFRGGHRLWLAPEVPEITYEPDDAPVDAGADDNSASATAVVGRVEKTIRVGVTPGEAAVTVDHVVVNRSEQPLEAALWAITQLRPGGTALLPIAADPSDPYGLQASTRVVGWPYTDWGALEVDTDRNVLHIGGTRDTPTKIGTALTRGWLGYMIDGWLFAKYARYAASPIDLGATGQIYACAEFVELETLGPLVTVPPGDTARHRETWRVWPAPGSLRAAAALVEASHVG